MLNLMSSKDKKAWKPPTLQDQMGNQCKVVNMHLTDDQGPVDIAVEDVVVVTTTEEAIIMIDQDQKELGRKRVTTRMIKTDLRLKKDQDDPIEVAAVDVDAAEDEGVDTLGVEDTSDDHVMMMVKARNIHKTVTDKEIMTGKDVRTVIEDHADSEDVHDVHHKAQETRASEVTVANRKSAEKTTANVAVVVVAADVPDATIAHASQELRAMLPKVEHQNVKNNLQTTLNPPLLKLKKLNLFQRCVVSVFLLIAT